MKTFAITFGIGAALGSSFLKNTASAETVFKKIGKRINEINESTKNIEKLKNLRKELITINSEIVKRKNRIVELSRELKKEGADTKKLKNEINTLAGEIKTLNKSYAQKKDIHNTLHKNLKEENIDVKNLNGSYRNLIKEKEKLQRIEARKKKVAEFKENWKNTSTTLISKGAGATAVGAGLLGTVIKPLKEAIKSESAFADVKKQFDFDTEEEAKAYRTRLENLIKEKNIAIDLKELYAAAASAGQSGIDKDESLDYIELATKMGIAFDMSREEAAKNMFEMKNAFNLPLPDLKNLVDQINYLGNTTGAAAPGITDFVNRVGNIGIGAGFKTNQIAAIGATLIEQGMAPEIAATGAKKLMGAMTKGFAATKGQIQVYKMLGLDSTQLAKDAQKDAEGTMLKILSRIKTLSKDKQGAVLTQLFGEEGLRGAAGLLNNMERLRKNFDAMKDPGTYKGSAEKEFQARQDTLENKLLVLQQLWTINLRNFGELLIPTISAGAEKLAKISQFLISLQEKHPKLFGIVAKSLLGLGAALTAVGTTSVALGTAMKGMGVIMSVLTNPVGLVIAGIVALVAAGYALYKNWDTIKAKGIELKDKVLELVDKYWYLMGPLGWLIKGGKSLYENWDTIKQKASELGGKIYELVDEYWYLMGPLGLIIKGGQKIYENWDLIKEKATELKDKVADFVVGCAQNWEEFKNTAITILNVPFDWIEQKIDAIGAKAKEMFSEVMDIYNGIKDFSITDTISKGASWIGEKIGISANPEQQAGQIPQFAKGGIVNSPTLALVGEGGAPESIIPHNNSPRSLQLWEKTGDIIGAKGNKDTHNVTINYAPVINTNNSSEIKEVLKQDKEQFYNQFTEFMRRYNQDNFRRGNGR